MKSSLVSKLEKDLKRQENHLKYRNLYNIKNSFMKTLIKSGIIIDYALPYIISGLLISTAEEYCLHNSPFVKDIVLGSGEIETIDSSYGLHQENKTYDFKYNEKTMEFSTAWEMLPDGTYSRLSTYYKFNEDILDYNLSEVLSLPEDELKSLFFITKQETIVKNYLTPDDYIYSEPALFVVNHYETYEYALRKETNMENVLYTSISMIIAFLLALEINNISKIFFKKTIKDKLNEIEPLYQTISKSDVEVIKQIIALKKANIDMIKNEDNNINNYQLRK